MDKKKELVSIIIPAYNAEKYIDDAIRSIIQQTYKYLEIYIINDGSTDQTEEKCVEWAQKDKRINVYTIENSGAPIARNNGIKKAKGKYIYFFDADDILMPNAIEILVKLIESTAADISIGNYVNQCGNKSEYEKAFQSLVKNDELFDINDKRVYQFPPLPGNKLYKNEIIQKNGIRFGDVKIGQDLNFYLKYLLHTKKVAYTKEIVFRYRIVEGSISRTYSKKIFEIVKSFADVEEYYNKYKSDIYRKQVSRIQLIHYFAQMNKYRKFDSIEDKNDVIEFFENAEKNISYEKKNWGYKDWIRYILYKMMCIFRPVLSRI